jgi:hypothetical protein
VKNWIAKFFGRCPKCWFRFSDWFTWGDNGLRFCYPCWHRSGYKTVIKEQL